MISDQRKRTSNSILDDRINLWHESMRRFVFSCAVSVLIYCLIFPTRSISAHPIWQDEAGVIVKQIAVIGDSDERLQGALPMAYGQLGALAEIYLGRALRVSFPHPGSLVATATPVCFPDVVLTVAHIYANIGDGNALPMGLRISVPDLGNPGEFRETLTVKDFRASTTGRNYDPDNLPEVRDDFLLLRLNQSLPQGIVPVGLLPFNDIEKIKAPVECGRGTVNAAYHADLGLLGNVVVSTDTDPGVSRIRAPGKTPLLTVASAMTPKSPNGERYGSWYLDPLVAFPQHDTHDSASGSAVICPDVDAPDGPPRDHLLGLMVGQMFLERSTRPTASRQPIVGRRPAINVATFNLSDIYRAIADLKDVPVELLHAQCTPFIEEALLHH